MPFKDELLFIKNETKALFEDETDKCVGWSFDGSSCRVIYKSNPEEVCSYKLEQVALLSQKYIIDGDEYGLIKTKSDSKKVLRDVREAAYFESNNADCEDRFQVISGRSGKICTYCASSLTPEKYARSYPIFTYLREICETLKPSGEPEGMAEYLPKQFKWLKFLDETAAACFVDPRGNQPKRYADHDLVIYPFGTNLSQMEAIDNALFSQLSLIEGPPGTGKTQSILGILANLIIRGKTSLVVSPNNEATKNVVKKLGDHGYKCVVAELGNKKNRDAFATNQPKYPDNLKKWAYPQEVVRESKKYLARNTPTLRKIFQHQQELAKCRSELEKWKLEYNHFLAGYDDFQALRHRPWTSGEHIKSLREQVAEKTLAGNSLGLLIKLKGLVFWGIGSWADYGISPIDLEIRLNRTLFEHQICKLEKRITESKSLLDSYDADKLIEGITQNSQIIFQSYLYHKYQQQASAGKRAEFDNPWEDPANFRNEYPVITSTTNAARNQMGRGNELFDYVIIDESSQADLVTGMLALSAARNAVVVGDTKQLPYVITPQKKKLCESIENTKKIPYLYSFTQQSLLSSLGYAVQDEILSAPRQLLKEHYRCHREIIGFCNQMFYNNELIVLSGTHGLNASEVLFISPTNDYNYDRSKDYNRVQAGQFLDDILPIFEHYGERSEIGIVTPYRTQATNMQNDERFKGIEIDTVHKYQGREKDMMSFVTRSNKINKFLDCPNLINVAVSRAKLRFSLIVAPEILAGANNIAELGRYIQYRSGTFVKPSVSSSFDLLYQNHENEREGHLTKREIQNNQYSEVQTAEWIDEILQSLDYNTQLGYLRNYPFKQFLVDLDPFDKEESRFINTSAHTDFLFYRKSDRGIIFDLEVNGSQHDYPVQMKRDATKASILSKVNISLEVLRTNEYDPKKYVSEIIEKYTRDPKLNPIIHVAGKDKNNPWENLTGRSVC